MNKVYYANELTHWGVKGQKWGIRRYQNEDGTLTEEGKKRYKNNPELRAKDERNHALHETSKRAAKTAAAVFGGLSAATGLAIAAPYLSMYPAAFLTAVAIDAGRSAIESALLSYGATQVINRARDRFK